jgi:hypothetical protein
MLWLLVLMFYPSGGNHLPACPLPEIRLLKSRSS